MKRYMIPVHSFCYPTAILFIALTIFNVATAEHMSPGELLRALTREDAHFLASFSLDADVKWVQNIEDCDSERKHHSIRITRADNTWAYESKQHPSVAMPRYVKSEHGYNGMPRFHGLKQDDRILIQRPIWTVELCEPKFSGVRFQQNVYVLEPSGKIVKEGSNNIVYLAKARVPLQDWRLYTVVLSTGRGFAAYINAIDDVTKQANGNLLIHANGEWPNPGAVPCTWHLEVDPTSQYLIRSATAITSNGYTIGTFETHGEIISGKGVISATARYKPSGESTYELYKEDGHSDITFKSLVDTADFPMIERVAAKFRRPYGKKTYVCDDSGPQSHAYTVEANTE